MKRVFAILIVLAFLVPAVSHAEFGMGKFMKKGDYDADKDGVIDRPALGSGSGTSGYALKVNASGQPIWTYDDADSGAVGGAPGAYQVNVAGAMGGGNIHHSAGVSTWQVDDAGHVIEATFHQTGEHVEWWAPSGETQYWSRNGTQSWHYDDPAGVSHFVMDRSGVTSYAPTGDVRYGTYELYDGLYTGGAHTWTADQTFESANTPITVNNSGAAGATVFAIEDDGFSGNWKHGAYNLPDNAVPAAAVSLYNANLKQSWTNSGVSPIGTENGSGVTGWISGTSIPGGHGYNVFIVNDRVMAQVYGLHPLSGASVPFLKFVESTAPAAANSTSGSGMTIYPANQLGQNAFQGLIGGTWTTGVSFLALPPGHPGESATVFGVISGETKYWHFDATSSWVCE